MRQNKDGSLSYPYASDAIRAIYGFDHAEIENDSNKIFALIHPEDVEAVIEKLKSQNLNYLKAGIAIFIHQRIGLA
jgi:transcriptional/translational regulatory protein YebC/TACO1